MNMKKIMEIANRNYPDGLVQQYFKTRKRVGDGLAEFIVHELKDVCDDRTPWEGGDYVQLTEGARAIFRGASELFCVAEALYKAAKAAERGRRHAEESEDPAGEAMDDAVAARNGAEEADPQG